MKLINILTYKIKYDFIKNLILATNTFLSCIILYYFLRAKTTSLTFTNKFIEVAHGILARQHDSIDMIDVRDQTLYRSILDRILRLSKVTVLSKDKTHPEYTIKLSKIDADNVLIHLQHHSTRSIVDYQLTKDLRNKKEE